MQFHVIQIIFAATHGRVAVIIIQGAGPLVSAASLHNLRTDQYISDGCVQDEQLLWLQYAQIVKFLLLIMDEDVDLC